MSFAFIPSDPLRLVRGVHTRYNPASIDDRITKRLLDEHLRGVRGG